MMMTYPIMANCNFSTRDDAMGQAVHAARRAVEAGLTGDTDLVAALDELEETLGESAEKGDAASVAVCRAAEREVQRAWTLAIQEEVDVVRTGRYVD